MDKEELSAVYLPTSFLVILSVRTTLDGIFGNIHSRLKMFAF